MKTEKKNLRRISIVVTAQTKGNLERLAAVCGYSEIGRVVDKLTREKMVKNNLNITAVANTLPMQRNTVLYHLDKIERETKLNPRHIHDLIDLLEIALEVL